MLPPPRRRSGDGTLGLSASAATGRGSSVGGVGGVPSLRPECCPPCVNPTRAPIGSCGRIAGVDASTGTGFQPPAASGAGAAGGTFESVDDAGADGLTAGPER